MMFIPKDEANGRPYDGYIVTVERDHLGYFSPLNASTPQYITGGNWEVVDGIAAFDKDTNLVYIPLIYLPSLTEDTL
jgi:dipeptidyl aminopeptidase B